jgi:hypothetical protein
MQAHADRRKRLGGRMVAERRYPPQQHCPGRGLELQGHATRLAKAFGRDAEPHANASPAVFRAECAYPCSHYSSVG